MRPLLLRLRKPCSTPKQRAQHGSPDAETASPDTKSDEAPAKRTKSKAKKKTDEKA
jgi:hypothetical protein